MTTATGVGTTFSQYDLASSGPQPTPVVPYPIALQAQAIGTVRKHALQAAVRRGSLLVADVGALYLLKFVLRAMRDHAMFGAAMRDAAQVLLPKGQYYPYEFTAALVVGLTVAGAYGSGNNRRSGRKLLTGTTLGMALISWGRFWASVTLHGSTSAFTLQSTLAFVLAVIAVGSVVLAERRLLDRLVGWLRPYSTSTTRVLAVGAPAECEKVIEDFVTRDRAFTSVGFLGVDESLELSVRKRRAAITQALTASRADAIVLCGELKADVATDFVRLADAAGCQVMAMRRLQSVSGLHPEMKWSRGVPFVQLSRPGLRGGQLVLKRVFDSCAASVGLVVLSPLLLLVATAVRWSSRGPVVFQQTRVGLGGRTFQMYKFRTMSADAENCRAALLPQNVYSDQRLFKVKNDPRITRLGHILRQSSLDELPQLWNVVRGEMSLVGPRPPLLSELGQYQEHDYVRFDMRPGVTGPWQVSGRNNITDFDEIVRLESDYMRGWSISRDAGILLRTMPVVISRAGAL